MKIKNFLKTCNYVNLPLSKIKRIEAAILYILKEAASRGDVFLPRQDLEKKVNFLIQNDNYCIDDSINNLCNKKKIVKKYKFS